MRLIKIPANDTDRRYIQLHTDNGNKFGAINEYGTLILFGEDSKLWKTEMREIAVITDNFDLFFNNIKTEL